MPLPGTKKHAAVATRLHARNVTITLTPELSSTSARGAGSRSPLGAVRLLLEVRARDERLLEVFGIVDDGGDGEPLIAVRLGMAIVVFGQRGALAVRHAVLSEI